MIAFNKVCSFNCFSDFNNKLDSVIDSALMNCVDFENATMGGREKRKATYL